MKNLKLILKSLLSNHACVEGGRRKAWYFAVPMFLFAMILALIPTFVQTWTKEGDSIVASNTYEFDVATYRFVEEINKSGIEMKVENKKLVVDEEKWNTTFNAVDGSGNNCYIHFHPNPTTGVYELPDLGVYYIPTAKFTDEKYQTIATFPTADSATRVNRTYSFVIFTDERVIFYVYAAGKSSGQSIGTVFGDYQNLPDGYLINSLNEVDQKTTWNNWKYFMRKAYDNNRIKTSWQTTLIMFGVNAGITIFMGFMLWVLTRGKNNLHWFGIWETQKIVAWACVSPAILTTGLGFLIASFSQVMFPLLLGVRIMWLSMKLLRPENADLYPPLKDNKKVVDVKPVK